MRLLELKEDKSYQPPSIDVGDEVLVGKFKNRRAEVKGFTTDDNNQPVLKTSKGDQHLFKPRIAKLMPDEVNEAFDKPYPLLRWEKGDFGDVDAIARLDDGTFLSIMFNKGFSKDTKEETWSVEFYRDNSQEITGKGDKFRVFATVLDAIKTFISDRVPGAEGKYKPNRVIFSASKQVEPGQKEQSRAGLYDSLVQRYARALGFRAFRADTGNKVIYELSRLKPIVAKPVEETINTDILNRRFKHTQTIGDYTYKASVEIFLDEPLLNIKAYNGAKEIGHAMFEIFHWEDAPAKSHIESGGTEVEPAYRNKGVASTMYAYAKMLGNDIRASSNRTDQGKSMWAAWEKSGDTKHLTGNSVAENFADGKTKGKSRPGRVKRSGASCDGSVTDLRSKAKDASGERAKMYHWCANMKSGRAKTESEILEDLNVIWKDVLEAGVYKGYPCTKDCSGHAAGDRWADARDITDPNQCPYSNNSFWEGCLAHTDEQE